MSINASMCQVYFMLQVSIT